MTNFSNMEVKTYLSDILLNLILLFAILMLGLFMFWDWFAFPWVQKSIESKP